MYYNVRVTLPWMPLTRNLCAKDLIRRMASPLAPRRRYIHANRRPKQQQNNMNNNKSGYEYYYDRFKDTEMDLVASSLGLISMFAAIYYVAPKSIRNTMKLEKKEPETSEENKEDSNGVEDVSNNLETGSPEIAVSGGEFGTPKRSIARDVAHEITHKKDGAGNNNEDNDAINNRDDNNSINNETHFELEEIVVPGDVNIINVQRTNNHNDNDKETGMHDEKVVDVTDIKIQEKHDEIIQELTEFINDLEDSKMKHNKVLSNTERILDINKNNANNEIPEVTAGENIVSTDYPTESVSQTDLSKSNVEPNIEDIVIQKYKSGTENKSENKGIINDTEKQVEPVLINARKETPEILEISPEIPIENDTLPILDSPTMTTHNISEKISPLESIEEPVNEERKAVDSEPIVELTEKDQSYSSTDSDGSITTQFDDIVIDKPTPKEEKLAEAISDDTRQQDKGSPLKKLISKSEDPSSEEIKDNTGESNTIPSITQTDYAISEANSKPNIGEENIQTETAYNPDTGEINWDCPCLGGMAHGPCGEEFRSSFSCFVYSENEPKGSECIAQFKRMQNCFRYHPEYYLDGEDGNPNVHQNETLAS